MGSWLGMAQDRMARRKCLLEDQLLPDQDERGFTRLRPEARSRTACDTAGDSEEERWGPVIIAERKRGKGIGQPWKSRHFATVFRGIATRAGLPDDWWSMDMRSGGVTEADGIDGITPHMIQDSAGHSNIKTQEIYRREKQRNANKVLEFRQAARPKREQ